MSYIIITIIKGKDIQDLNEEWEENGERIGIFLNSLLRTNEMENLMIEYLKATFTEIIDIINHKDAIKTGDIASKNTMKIAEKIYELLV